MNYYNIEITNLLDGELDYTWVRRYSTTAKSIKGAIKNLERHLGTSYRHHEGEDNYYGDWSVYHDMRGEVGVHITMTDSEENQKGEEI